MSPSRRCWQSSAELDPGRAGRVCGSQGKPSLAGAYQRLRASAASMKGGSPPSASRSGVAADVHEDRSWAGLG
jgi:hypothetical protein